MLGSTKIESRIESSVKKTQVNNANLSHSIDGGYFDNAELNPNQHLIYHTAYQDSPTIEDVQQLELQINHQTNHQTKSTGIKQNSIEPNRRSNAKPYAQTSYTNHNIEPASKALKNTKGYCKWSEEAIQTMLNDGYVLEDAIIYYPVYNVVKALMHYDYLNRANEEQLLSIQVLNYIYTSAHKMNGSLLWSTIESLFEQYLEKKKLKPRLQAKLQEQNKRQRSTLNRDLLYFLKDVASVIENSMHRYISTSTYGTNGYNGYYEEYKEDKEYKENESNQDYDITLLLTNLLYSGQAIGPQSHFFKALLDLLEQ